MKSFLHSSLVALFVLISLVGCSKEEDATPTTALELTITDNTDTPVSGATVKLYTSQANLKEQTNEIGKAQISDANGKVTFKDLEAIKYYWRAEKGCQNNIQGIYETPSPITANQLNASVTVLTATGTLKMTNNSNDPYQVYIDGKLVFTAQAGYMYTFEYVPTNSYSIRVVQVSGYGLHPTDKSYNAKVVCGATTNIVFPNI